MPTFRVFLECTSATSRPGGAFDTFVHVSDDEMADGAHLRVACRRAAILGFGGPHRIREVRRLDSPVVVRTAVEDARSTMEARLRVVLRQALATTAGPAAVDVHAESLSPRRRARGRARARAR